MKLICGIAAWACYLTAFAQGTFQNLDFESAEVSLIAPNSDLSIARALPDWSASYGNASVSEVSYDGISLGGVTVSVVDQRSRYSPSQGSYGAFLFGGVENNVGLVSAEISQTAVVPPGTQSLLFDGYNYGAPFIVSLGGQTITMTPLENLPNTGSFPAYTLYGANIPASFSGRTETLSFSEPPATGVQPSLFALDDIVFSPNTVTPEPDAIALMGIGGLLFGLYHRVQACRK